MGSLFYKRCDMTKTTRTTKITKTKKVEKTTKPVKKTEISVLGIDGKAKGTMTLPAEVFGAKVNKPLMAQAVRVYLANQRKGGAATKTRGMVEGSTRKIYRQKGTGRARHGGIRAPIFVGGGVAFGPVPHDFSLKMPTKMKRRATASALTSQFREGRVRVVDGLEGLKPKTKYMQKTVDAIAKDSSVLLVLPGSAGIVGRIARNIANVDTLPVSNLNTYDVLSHTTIVFMKEAIKQFVL